MICVGCRIEDELIDGVEYWRLEQSLCTALSNRQEASSERLYCMLLLFSVLDAPFDIMISGIFI